MRLLLSISAQHWLGKLDSDLRLSPELVETITKTMHELSAEFPTIAHLNIRGGAQDGQLATKSNTAILLNAGRWQDETQLKKYAKEWEGCLVDPTPRGVIVHEVGHILDGQLLSKLGSKRYNKWMDQFLPDRNAISNEHTSPYGMENVFEFMGETFAAHFLKHAVPGAHPRFQDSHLKLADKVWNQVRKLLHA